MAEVLLTNTQLSGETIVRVDNVGENDFVGRYLTENIRLLAGQSAFCPWAWVVYWLGNPYTKDRDREQEYRRLHTLYASYDDPQRWETNRPRLEVYTSTGERIHMVIDDPEGKQSPVMESNDRQIEVLREGLEQMQRKYNTLLEQSHRGDPLIPDSGETQLSHPDLRPTDAPGPIAPEASLDVPSRVPISER